MSEQVNMATRYEREIPEGYEARIEGNKVIFELKESEYEKIRKEIQEFLRDNCGAGQEAYKKCEEWCYWLEKQKEQKPAELSEEKIVNWLKENFYVSSFDNTKIVTRFSSMDDLIKSVRKRLKSLRPQPKQEQDEVDDEEWLGSILRDYEGCRPQPHWKPSEEQMNALRVSSEYESCLKHREYLKSLYNDLKKL